MDLPLEVWIYSLVENEFKEWNTNHHRPGHEDQEQLNTTHIVGGQLWDFQVGQI